MGGNFDLMKRAGSEFSASQGRTDGVMVSIKPVYHEAWRLIETISADKCYAKGSVEPSGPEIIELNSGDGFAYSFSSFLDVRAPDGVYFCYMLIGRGVVEGMAWGFRVPEHQDQVKEKPVDNGMVASRDRSNGVEIVLSPPSTADLSTLLVTGDDISHCPKANEFFIPGERRFIEVLSHYFNGKWAFDEAAAYEADLCYVAVSRLTNQVIGSALGFRPHPSE